MANREKPIWFITDPSEGPIGIPSPQVRSRFHRKFDEDIESFDICGRSWTLPPQDLIELAFNTFKPIYCHGRKGLSPLSQLLQRVHWSWYLEGGKLGRLTDQDISSEPVDRPIQKELMIICSDRAVRDLLGTTVNRIYSWHSRRDDSREEKMPLLLSQWKLPSASLLMSMPMEGQDVELIVLPRPKEGKMFPRAGDKEERFEEMRLDYIRRVHSQIGCGQHGIW